MNNDSAVTALAALAQEHRLSLFRLLVKAGEGGMPAGAIAQALHVPNSSLSFHLAQLRNAGLILLGFVLYHLDGEARSWAELSKGRPAACNLA